MHTDPIRNGCTCLAMQEAGDAYEALRVKLRHTLPAQQKAYLDNMMGFRPSNDSLEGVSTVLPMDRPTGISFGFANSHQQLSHSCCPFAVHYSETLDLKLHNG